MDEKKYYNFLMKLIAETKNGKIEWNYLDKDLELCRQMGWAERLDPFSNALLGGNNPACFFNKDSSFYCNLNRTYIVLFVKENDPVILYIIPYTLKNIGVMNPEKFGQYTTRLLNLVRSQFPSAEAFVDEFLASGD